MKKMIMLFILSFQGNLFYGQETAAKLDIAQKAYILSRFCTEVKYNFAYYDQLGYNWDSLCTANLPSLTQTASDDAFIDGLKRLCSQLHDGHTFIFAQNNPENPDDWIRPFPMKTKRIGNQVFVTAVYNTGFQKKGLCPGCEILEINGENVFEYAKNHLQPFLASSTPQWLEYASFGEFELTKDKGSKVTKILFRNIEGKTFAIESNRNIEWDLPDNSPAIEFKVIDNNIGLLTISSFQNGNFSRKEFDKIYTGLVKTDALIIDIRDNSGGNSSHADYVISHFSDRSIPKGDWRSPMYIAAHGSWNYPREWYMQTSQPLNPVQGKEIYKKPVVLLVNAGTFSSAENFCVTFKGAKRGKVIGTPTGGSTGNPIFIDLGYGIGCCICTKQEWDAEGNEFVGTGILPDVNVKENTDRFYKNKDNLIEAALKELK